MSQQDLYRVVLDGIGSRSGSVASSPATREKAMAGFDAAVGLFGMDVSAGQLRISLLTESEYVKRA